MKLVFCTNNQHKIDEVSQIMGNGFSFFTLQEVSFFDEIPEPYSTIEENSLTKSKQVYDKLGLDCFSEDTGLFVPELNNEPGVYSARYAGESATSSQNINKLLNQLNGKIKREAYFKTVITLILNGEVFQFEGICEGKIAIESKGIDGFGYDPVFIPQGGSRSFAELSSEEKNTISHRKKAFDKLSDYLLRIK